MTVTLRSLPRLAAVTTGVAAALLGLLAAPAAAAVTGPCTATLNGVDVSQADSPSRAIEVDIDDVIAVRGTDATNAPFTKISLRFPPLPAIGVHDDKNDPPEPTWGGEADVGDYAFVGVGLYQVVGETDDCRGTAWVKVTGRSPFLTIAGGLGTVAALGGLVTVATGAARARPSWSSLFRSSLAGVPLGLGAALLTQQLGLLPLTGATAAAWTAAGVSASGLANLGVAALRS
jgi:hypothetical protein